MFLLLEVVNVLYDFDQNNSAFRFTVIKASRVKRFKPNSRAHFRLLSVRRFLACK